MKIFLTGVETNNKGAELMLYAILQEIERKFPGSTIFIEKERIPQGISYLETAIEIVLVENKVKSFFNKYHINGILRRLGMKEYLRLPNIPRFDYLIDGSGLAFTDSMVDEYTDIYWTQIIDLANKYNAKKIFLPQGFGPFNKQRTKRIVSNIINNANLIFARDVVSLGYLKEFINSGINNIKLSPDFTSLVKGHLPTEYEHLKGCVCIIPNSQMVNKGEVSENEYLTFISSVVAELEKYGKKLVILNHQGKDDLILIDKIKEELSTPAEIITGQNALITKGIISSSYLVVTSRFHGLASSLNSGVPCLSTSWNHKYKCLLDDYNIENSLLSVKDLKHDIQLIKKYMEVDFNKNVRNLLDKGIQKANEQTKAMWKLVWN